jgi:hypothetical protein
MSNYTLAVNWSGKDGLSDSDAAKVISGSDFNSEFTTVRTAINSKADINGDASESFSCTTASAGTNTTQTATTAYVTTAVAALDGAAINALVYPVGSIYFNAAVSTNPNTLLGFGTWEAYGGGRVPVGVHSSGTFDGLNETGGAETHTLSIAEIPAHTHSKPYEPGLTAAYAAPAHDSYFSSTTNATGSTGGGTAHNNLQPYITVYMWKRTA